MLVPLEQCSKFDRSLAYTGNTGASATFTALVEYNKDSRGRKRGRVSADVQALFTTPTDNPSFMAIQTKATLRPNWIMPGFCASSTCLLVEPVTIVAAILEKMAPSLQVHYQRVGPNIANAT